MKNGKKEGNLAKGVSMCQSFTPEEQSPPEATTTQRPKHDQPMIKRSGKKMTNS